MTKAQHISKMILDKMSSVASANAVAFNDAAVVKAAVDHVLGAGTYDKLVSDLYDELNGKAV